MTKIQTHKYTVTEAAKLLGISSIKLKRILRQNSILLWGTEGPKKIKVERIHKKYIDAGYFTTEDRWWNDNCTEVIYITDKGVDFIKSLLTDK